MSEKNEGHGSTGEETANKAKVTENDAMSTQIDETIDETEIAEPTDCLEAQCSSEEKERLKKIYFRLDCILIPTLWCLYLLMSAIRAAHGIALTLNIESKHSLIQTLSLSSADIARASTMFWLSYVIFEVPSNLVMAYVDPHIWIFRLGLSIGVVSCFHALISRSSKSGLFAIRFFLGMCEAGFWPSIIYYVSCFYEPNMRARRIAWVFIAAQVAGILIGIYGYLVGKLLDGVAGLKGFEWMYIILGIAMIITSTICFWVLPQASSFNKENKTVWQSMMNYSTKQATSVLSVEERELLSRTNAVKADQWEFSKFMSILLNYKIWLLIFMYFGPMGVGNGIQTYGTLIVKQLNLPIHKDLLSIMISPIWAADIIGVLLNSYISDRYKQRLVVYVYSVVIVILGFLLTTFISESNAGGRYAGLVIVGLGNGSTVPVLMAWCTQIFGQEYQALGSAFASSLVSSIGNTGSILTTYALYTGWKGDTNFRKSNLTIISILVTCIMASIALWSILNKSQNRLLNSGK